MDSQIARKMWRTLEPYHSMIYFVPEAIQGQKDLKMRGPRPRHAAAMGYFASRAAPLGAASAELVIATFFNFNPELVRSVIPDAWEIATPDEITANRLHSADSALRRMLADHITSPEMIEAAKLAREATTACSPIGRPLYAAHASLPWPEAPHLILWHAITLLREFRSDGHIALLLGEQINGCEALILYAATGAVPPIALQKTRGWSNETWAATSEGLRQRGWLNADGSLTEEGAALRESIETRTDQLAMAPWEHLGHASCTRLRHLVRPFSKAIAEAGTFPKLFAKRARK